MIFDKFYTVSINMFLCINIRNPNVSLSISNKKVNDLGIVNLTFMFTGKSRFRNLSINRIVFSWHSRNAVS